MTTLRTATLVIGLTVGGGAGSAPATLQAQSVRAVLFFSPTCQHCEQVMTQDLPTFFQVYGGHPEVLVNQELPGPAQFAYLVTNGRLEILMVDVSRPDGGALYQASLETHPTEPRRLGVPRLIVEDDVFVGSVEIPSRLHGKIRTGLEGGGPAWPTIPGVDDVVATLTPPTVVTEDESEPQASGDSARMADDTAAGASRQPAPEPAAQLDAPAGPDSGVAPTEAAAGSSTDSVLGTIPFEQMVERRPSVRERFLQDPVGNAGSVVVLLLMIGSLVAVPRLAGVGHLARVPDLAIPVAAALGIGVAGYLTYVELSGATAVCGPVGDCNTVNQSEYAVLFGLLPVGVLGLIGYLVIFAGWAVARWADGSAADIARVALLAMALVGTVFSVYLTFLEPFVIGATCAWCLTSAMLITLLLWLSAGPGLAAWARLRAPATSA